ncbi:hypothetical protein TPA0910_52470 [Streptomyces hygroscopicus subsp. sporocinereus]|uniref:Uncharacterized protein n=1 Tax=Streptomyces hygroscopicus TaxID=1912 RepID=A0ABQ3U5C5_STRHY|nr:hypothetical protein [Streptomyces hygroscopicus]GHJ30814.1 hypothetical protein TPA0910_52470 [Streptomyces hygroscopicus]
MSDAMDLSMVASSALPATFTFLYQRLEALLSRHRSGEPTAPETTPEVPAQLVGTLQLPLQADPDRLNVHLATLNALALSMAHYQRASEQVVAGDPLLAQTLGQVREVLEDVYGQRFTFEGERRAQSGPITEHRYERVSGEVIGIEAQDTIRGGVKSVIDAKSVERGAKVVGMKARVIEGCD